MPLPLTHLLQPKEVDKLDVTCWQDTTSLPAQNTTISFPYLVVPYKNMEDIISAMHNKEVAGALLDMYAAATMKTMLEGGDIQLNRLIEYPTGYGFVLSGDMAKAAPLLRQALSARKTKVSEIVEENTDSISLVSI